MIVSALTAALGRLPTPEFRGVFFKSLGLTLVALIALWFGLRELFEWAALPWIDAIVAGETTRWEGWLGVFASIAAAILIAIALALLIAPVTALVAGFFLDDAAAIIEREDYPSIAPGEEMPIVRGAILSVRFLGLVVIGNIVAFALLLVPGINLVAFLVINAYLLSREYFQVAALRYRSYDEANLLRRRHGLTIFLAGLIIAGFLSIPIVNLLTPLFAAAFMVHLHMKISERDDRFALPPVSGPMVPDVRV